jgi:hypothetical protein
MNTHVRAITVHQIEPHMRLLSPAYMGAFVEKVRHMIDVHRGLGLELTVSSAMAGGRLSTHAVRLQIGPEDGQDRFVISLTVDADVATVNQAVFMATVELEVWMEELGYDAVRDILLHHTKPVEADLATYGIDPQAEVEYMTNIARSDPEFTGHGR